MSELFMAFPGHATCRLRSGWPLARWRSLARIGARAPTEMFMAFPGHATCRLRSGWPLARIGAAT